MATTATIRNLSALGLLVLATDGATFTFDDGRVFMSTPAMNGRAVEVRNAERFGAVPTDSGRKGLAAGRSWVAEFERQAEDS